MTVKKRGGHWYFDFQIRGVRYREAIPEARTKFQAEQAETKARDQVFQGTYGTSQLGNQDFGQFVTTLDSRLPQTNVVEVLVSRLRSKIDEGFEQKMVQTIRGVGYVLQVP